MSINDWPYSNSITTNSTNIGAGQCPKCGGIYTGLGHWCQQPQAANQNQSMYDWLRQWQSFQKAQHKPIELPDEFTEWVEEVQKQKRMEELVQAVYDSVMKRKTEE